LEHLQQKRVLLAAIQKKHCVGTYDNI